MIKQLIMVYLLSPFAVGNISGWWSPILMAITRSRLFGIEEASQSRISGGDQNCLDMETFTMRIARDVGQMAATKCHRGDRPVRTEVAG
jgi:predicted membrane chloride channel (bestrophin family)